MFRKDCYSQAMFHDFPVYCFQFNRTRSVGDRDLQYPRESDVPSSSNKGHREAPTVEPSDPLLSPFTLLISLYTLLFALLFVHNRRSVCASTLMVPRSIGLSASSNSTATLQEFQPTENTGMVSVVYDSRQTS